ncbi:granulin b [Chelmon rostratus]|uniref:granulin b n=1 Tax=Chelmon rostratus TaxID=109905 RepID=UPI001BEA5E86|nr:granulin b [Chelmon rostratus]
MTLQMGILCLALLGLSTALVCPDGGMCEDKNTCCKNTVGGYGCCPLPHAECCSDHLHCCFEGTVCDLVHAKCVNKTVSLPWVRRVPSKQALLIPQLGGRLKAVICPDQQSECPDDTTCCQLLDGSWGCCPLAKAVCCEDKLHCCPEGTKCDIAHSRCLSASLESFPMMEKLPARRMGNNSASTVSSVTCPDGRSSCPDSFTCCLLTSGDYGCCPYPEAMCCSDHLHCCPSNTICDLEHGVCKSGATNVSVMKKISAVPNDVECPDKKSACPDGTTCCQMTNGTYGCCPMPNAVCCSDHIHCCPAGTECDLAHSTCVSARGDTSVKTPAAGTELTAVHSKGGAVPCNDSVACADGSTCCKSSKGQWACCPLPKAVCCDDHVHCCPHGTVCNLEAESCDDPAGFLPPRRWLDKVPARSSELREVKCDKQTMCPGGTTCCKKDSGLWACCPLPQAVCCTDREHCCPKGYKCNMAAQSCDKPGALSLSWLQKVPALQTEPGRPVSAPARPAKNMCDDRTSCPKDTTCCFMDKSHKWGCCPLPKAVCCNDGNHCCPSGHTCDPHRSSCSKGPHAIPWFTKLSALTEPGAVTDVKCDDKSSCASGTTCCKLQTGEWGCCPLVKAVCCADHEHCCPQGYTCNMETGTCEKKNRDVLVRSLPHSKVVRSEPRDAGGDADVPCDGTGEFHCPERDTCCKISATEWACCPSPRAVCCSDSKHCCPAGYTCDLKSGGCSQHSQLTWDTLFGDRKKDSVQRGL